MASDLKDLTSKFLAGRHLLMSFIYGLVRDPAASEDLFQEVWIKLAESAERGVEIEDLPKWSRGVARNLILHYWREKRGSKLSLESRVLDMAEVAFSESESSPDAWSSRRAALIKCVETLPEHSKGLLRMKYDGGLPVADMAARLNRSCNGIMVSLTRLRKALAECVGRRLRLVEDSP